MQFLSGGRLKATGAATPGNTVIAPLSRANQIVCSSCTTVTPRKRRRRKVDEKNHSFKDERTKKMNVHPSARQFKTGVPLMPRKCGISKATFYLLFFEVF